MRGFELAFDGEDAFMTAAPIVLGGVAKSGREDADLHPVHDDTVGRWRRGAAAK